MIAVDLSKQQALDADPKEIQQINFTANLDILEILESIYSWRSKRNCLRLFTRNCERFANAILLKCVIEWFNSYQHKMTQCNTII